MYKNQEVSDKRLFVRNIPLDWDEWNVFHMFKQFGVVNDIKLPVPKNGGYISSRFGFVEMHKEDGAIAAIMATRNPYLLKVDGSRVSLCVERCLLAKSKETCGQRTSRPFAQQKITCNTVPKVEENGRKNNETVFDKETLVGNGQSIDRTSYSREQMIELKDRKMENESLIKVPAYLQR